MNPLLKLAIVSGGRESLRLQIARGANLNAVDENQRSALILAAIRGDAAICELLLDAGVTPSTRDRSGMDALEHARARGHASVIELLSRPASALEPAAAVANELDVELSDTDGFGDWEAEDEPLNPEDQTGATEASVRIQASIAAFEPMDDYADWDVDVELPEEVRQRRGDLREFELAQIKLLIEQGIEESRAILGPVLEQIYGDDIQSAREMRSRLEIVCGDLGIVIEDDAAYSGAHAFSESNPHHDAAVNDAIVFLESLGSRHTDPLVQFYKEMQRYPLLTKDDEQKIGQEMEAAEDAALRAFAGHRWAVDAFLEVASAVESGSRSLESVIDTDPSAPAGIDDSETDGETEWPPPSPGDEGENEAEEAGDSLQGFVSRLQELRGLHAITPRSQQIHDRIATVLQDMRLRWSVVSQLGRAAAREHAGLTESIVLANAISDVRASQHRFFHSNLRLVFSVARKYSFRSLPLADLVQEGSIGLMKAVGKFQYRLGFKFSTYAMWWVKQAITRALADQERLIRLPVHVVESITAMERESRRFEQTHGRDPSIVELARLLSIDESKVKKLRSFRSTMVDLDDSTSDPWGQDFLVDGGPDLEKVAEALSLERAVKNLLKSLDARSADVISKRFGIGTDNEMTLEEVGRSFAVTRERIRQIEAKALRKLRQPIRRLIIDGYVPDEFFRAETDDSSQGDDSDDDAAPKPEAPVKPKPILKQVKKEAPARPAVSVTATLTPASEIHDIEGSPDSWAEAAKRLAMEYQLRVIDLRSSGGGMYVEVQALKPRAWKIINTQLKKLGFVFTVSRGFWRK